MTEQTRRDGPVEISKNVFWVGASFGDFLRRNVYLRVFANNGRTLSMLVDPGPPVDLEAVTRKVSEVIGGPEKLNFLTINHQDPDVCANAAHFAKVNPKLIMLMTEDTWRLVQYYGIDHNHFRAVERFTDLTLTLPTGDVLQFVPTPFCHFRGACMVYDRTSRILFSGDLFGGIAAPTLMAEEAGWMGVKAFHQLYMPSNEALRLAVKKIRGLDPPPLMIAPQHGGILSGAVLELFLDKMEELQVGLDIITSFEGKTVLFLTALNRMLTAARELAGAELVAQTMRYFHPDGSYPALFILDRKDVVTDVKTDPVSAVEALVKLLLRRFSAEQREKFQLTVMKIFLELNLPPPDAAFGGGDLSGPMVEAPEQS